MKFPFLQIGKEMVLVLTWNIPFKFVCNPLNYVEFFMLIKLAQCLGLTWQGTLSFYFSPRLWCI